MRSMQARKAHSLIGQVNDPRNLARAWERVKENKGAGGVDGVTVSRFEENRDYYLGLLHRSSKMAVTGHGPCDGSRSTSRARRPSACSASPP